MKGPTPPRANSSQVENPDDPAPIAWPLKVLGAGWLLLALGTLVTFWQGPYLFNLASSFRAHLVLALLIFGLPLALFYPRPKRWAFLALPLAVSGTFLSYLAPHTSLLDPARSSQVTLALANVYSGNHDLRALTAWVAQEQPDVLGLLEVTEAHRAQLDSLPLPHKTLLPRQSNFGLALLSKEAPEKVEVLEEGTPFPSLLATFPKFRLLLTHPIPPISGEARIVGDQQVERLVSKLNNGSSPLVVMGDLNATGWDSRLVPLKAAGMREARLGHGFLPTWPADRPFLGIPIDHIYLPPGWESLECRRGPLIGSDHFPLLAKVAWPGP